MDKTTVLVASSSYLEKGHTERYLSYADDYEVIRLSMSASVSAIDSEAYSPNICIAEYIGKHHESHNSFLSLIERCNERNVAILTVVSKGNLREYLTLPSAYLRDFILLPLSRVELLGRVALALNVHPFPLERNMIEIDYGLAINFDSCLIRIGKNKYKTCQETQSIFLKYLYGNINKWVSSKDLEKLPCFNTNANSTHIYNMIYNVRSLIEPDHRHPQFLLSNKRGYYMLRSSLHPDRDPVLGYKMLKRGSGSHHARGN